jgi:hypothetical protein
MILTISRYSAAIKLCEKCGAISNNHDAIARLGIASLLSGTLSLVRASQLQFFETEFMMLFCSMPTTQILSQAHVPC